MPSSPRRPWLGVAAAGFLLIGLLAGPEHARAGNIPTSIASTFELVPESHLIRVTVVLNVTNRIPSTTQGNTTTNYYVNTAGFSVDPAGTNYRLSTTGGSAHISIGNHEEGFLPNATVTFPAIYYGQSRTITTTYDIPSGAPRSLGTQRAGMAYAIFCGFPGGVYPGDPESLRILVPDRFTVDQYSGLDMATTSADGKTVLTWSGARSPGSESHSACIEATDENAFQTGDHTSPGGIHVTTKNWPEDTEWQQAVSAEVGPQLDALEEAIGRAPDAEDITVQEVLGEALSGYAGEFDEDTGIARVSEDALDPLIAAHELAHAWFNVNWTAENWLWEGYAEYYGRLVSETVPCSLADVSAYPGDVQLSDWSYLPEIPTADDEALVDAQYNTACWVVTAVADKVGAEGMQEITAAATDDEIAYLGNLPAEKDLRGPVSWRVWLDLADERGLVPAGEEDLDWLQGLLLEYGAASSGALLSDRSDARAAYHALLTATDDWSAPLAIREPMADWKFDDATAEIGVGTDIDDAHDASVDLVPEVSESTVVEDAYESAETDDHLAETLDVAEAEEDAAVAVAAAVSAAEADRNPLEAVGLIGADLATDSSAAVDELVAGDFETATTTADATAKSGADAALSGALRLGAVLLLGAAVGGGVVYWRRRQALKVAPVDGPTMEGDQPEAPMEAPPEVPAEAVANAPSEATTDERAEVAEPAATDESPVATEEAEPPANPESEHAGPDDEVLPS